MKKFIAVFVLISFGFVFILDVYPGALDKDNEEKEEKCKASLATAIQNLRLSDHYEIKWLANSVISQDNTGQFVHYNYYNYETLKEGYFSLQERSPSRAQIRRKPKSKDRRIIGELFAGIAGGFVLGFVAGSITSRVVSSPDDDMWAGIGKALLGFAVYNVASIFGSALGVSLVGNSENVKGSFGKALLGAALGQAIGLPFFVLAILKDPGNIYSHLALAVFFISPTIVAMLFFNRSLKYKSPPGNALLNLDKGKFNIGVPQIHIQPFLIRYTNNEKRSFMVNVNLINITF